MVSARTIRRKRFKEHEDSVIRRVCSEILLNKVVNHNLPYGGKIHIDRQLPFLCVYREPYGYSDQGTRRLVSSEASYLIASDDEKSGRFVKKLVRAVTDALSGIFGSFLLIEVWSARSVRNRDGKDYELLKPEFRLHVNEHLNPSTSVETLEKYLKKMKVVGRFSDVEIVDNNKCAPDHLPILISPREAKPKGFFMMGIEIKPVYRDATGRKLYPVLLRSLRKSFSRILKQVFFEFTSAYTSHKPEHFHALGRRSVVKLVWEIDEKLSEISNSFDFLLQVTPMNAESAWNSFVRHYYEREPKWHYRPLPIDPSFLKRKLYSLPLEKIEDPTLYHLFYEKQNEIDRRLTMLGDVGTQKFRYGSMQLFGGIDDEIIRVSEKLLKKVPSTGQEIPISGHIDACSFLKEARQEISLYRSIYPDFDATIQIRKDIYSGLMVSRGSLLIGSETRIPKSRVNALIHHEIGTHLLTYFNGRYQPFRQLYTGLASYEDLQEGLAVLAEYLAGGLSNQRIRVLAGRVIAVNCLIEGATFVDTFRILYKKHKFQKKAAYTIAMRVYRGGGLTKDSVYLEGLRKLFKYLQKGNELETLYIGKIALNHVPIVKELLYRHVLKTMPLIPRYIGLAESKKRLNILKEKKSLLELLTHKS